MVRGLILIDKNGNYSPAHITKKMAYAYVDNSEVFIAGINLNI